MKNLFKFKKLSVRLTVIIGAFVVIVAGLVAAYMQTRIISEIRGRADLALRYQLLEIAAQSNAAITQAQTSGGDGTYGYIEYVEDLVRSVTLYDTGFAILRDSLGEFYETNDFVRQLESGDKNALASAASGSPGETFNVHVSGIDYHGASIELVNGYELFIMAPSSEVNADITASLIRFVIIFVSAFTIVVVIAYFISRNIARPLIALSAFMRRAAATGDFALYPEDSELSDNYAKIPDETGQTIRDSFAFLDHVRKISDKLEAVAGGDLTVEIETLSDADVMGSSLQNMVESLNGLFSNISQSTVQVANGSKQIADGAQVLAQGSMQQANTVQQLSSSVAELAEKTIENAEMAHRAAELADAIKGNAEKGSQQMDDMTRASNEISQASQDIQKVIKVIDDIAFQTNILALNAAVEAARAGQHGKGFAVVAEEVRNLAGKSAEAAKDTNALIVNSIEKAELGSRIADETSKSLAEIVSGIGESSLIIGEIAESSETQSAGISQINDGISQVNQVVGQNSATAQESAAASEEMSGQSAILEELIAQFKLKGDSKGGGLYLPS